MLHFDQGRQLTQSLISFTNVGRDAVLIVIQVSFWNRTPHGTRGTTASRFLFFAARWWHVLGEMSGDLVEEALVDELLVALAMQAPRGRVRPKVLESFAECSRPLLRSLVGHLGHLVHYGCGSEAAAVRLTTLLQHLIATLRRASRGRDGVRPGDLVELRTRATPLLRVISVGDDGTVDVSPANLMDDYVVLTVPLREVAARAASSTPLARRATATSARRTPKARGLPARRRPTARGGGRLRT